MKCNCKHCHYNRSQINIANEKIYLGDGAYAKFDGFGILLTAENGISVTNEIYLEPEVLQKLFDFVKQLEDAAKDHS